MFLREENDITQKTLAKDINITETSLSRYENDLREPKAEIIKKLAKRLNTSADFLLGCSDDINKTKSNPNNKLLYDISSLTKESREDVSKYVKLLKIKEATLSNQRKKK